jgi:hypothetical protein
MTEQQQYMTLPRGLAGQRQHARVGVPVARTYAPPNIFPQFFSSVNSLMNYTSSRIWGQRLKIRRVA